VGRKTVNNQFPKNVGFSARLLIKRVIALENLFIFFFFTKTVNNQSIPASELSRFTLQQDLVDTLQKCEDQWMMLLHPDKCKVLQITRAPQQSKYTVHGQVLNNVQLRQVTGFEQP
jgi:hypothetical protein